MIRKLSRWSLAIGTAGVLLAAGLAGPAQAEAPATGAMAPVTAAAPAGPEGDVEVMASCGGAGYACFWTNANFSGVRGRVAGANSDFLNLSNSSGCTRYPGTWNDCISSIRNDGTQCTVYFWTDRGYKGRYHSLGIGDQVGNFAGAPYNDPNFNDAISSNHWCRPAP